ncbi:hypothetical protein ASF55_18285 [Methylobacterium sp. Leaf119]|nr:pectate lyase L precursor [Methylorubrum extorquens PA1]KQP93888.1 hypothetical protein ASF55_18285 [Methylobacterium sp. Leaf119]
MTPRRLFLARVGAALASTVVPYGGTAIHGGLRAAEAQPRSRTGRTLFVAPNGEDGDRPEAGASSKPYATLPWAFRHAAPGDTILLRGGVYGFSGERSGWLLAHHGGEQGRPITIANYPGEVPILDGRAMSPPTGPHEAWASSRTAGGFPLAIWDASHVTLRGLTIRNGPMGGAVVNGTHHALVIEECVFHENGWLNDEDGTGLGLYGIGSDNVVRNCDSFGNHGGGLGATGGNADGFQIFLHGASTGTIVTGNRAWRNTDDGFDFFNVVDVHDGSPCLIDGNWSFENGHLPDGSMNPSDQGNGNGFKLGGRRLGAMGTHGGHTVTRCLAWGNKMNGFDENGGNTGGVQPHTVYNNTSFNNARNLDSVRGELGFAFLFKFNRGTVLRNNIAFATRGRNEVLVRLATHTHNLRNGAEWDALDPPIALGPNDFQSLDDTVARGPRTPDGSLPSSGFLRLAPGSGLIGRGTSLGLPRTVTVDGGLPDIGAFQSGR